VHHLTISKCTCDFDLAFFSCVKFQKSVIYNEKSLKFIGTCLTVWYVINVYKYSAGALKKCVFSSSWLKCSIYSIRHAFNIVI